MLGIAPAYSLFSWRGIEFLIDRKYYALAFYLLIEMAIRSENQGAMTMLPFDPLYMNLFFIFRYKLVFQRERCLW